MLTYRAHLSPQEVRRLTLFKWRYSLEGRGFSHPDIQRLVFTKWRVQVHLGVRAPQR
jgi:hypothetical protein